MRRVLPLFGGAVTLAILAFASLGWRLAQHENAVAVQRQQQRLDAAADFAAAAVLRHAAGLGTQLAALAALPSGELPSAIRRIMSSADGGAHLVVIDADRVDVHPSGGLAYYPPQPAPPLGDETFAAAEAHEFGARDVARAIRTLEPLAVNPDPVVRAGALLRLGRNLHKLNRTSDAVHAYRQLEGLGDLRVAGLPAELLARYARCALFEKLEDRAALAREAAALAADLDRGRWRIDRPTYLFYTRAAQQWAPGLEAQSAGRAARLELAAAVDSLWIEWRGLPDGEGDYAGVRAAGTSERPLMVMWRTAAGRLVAFAASPTYIQARWLAAPRSTDDAQVRYTLETGVEADAAPRLKRAVAVRAAEDTGLPWKLRVASADPDADVGEIAARRRLIFAVLALVGCTLAASAYSIRRAIGRELQIFRLQSDFIAAVSHEFRSPLTSIRQIAELLAAGRIASEERRGVYYNLLMRESQRLQRLVENVLDFGRAEAGTGEYRRDPVDLAGLVRETVADFQPDAAARGFAIELTGVERALAVRGDAEALGRALWNLLDNAVKYSAQCRTVWVTVTPADRRVTIAVRDRGIGIAAGEMDAIFARFVRGASAQATGAKGTGLGLAMVRHITRAHGGDVTVESVAGSGSTFRISIPTEDTA